MGKAEKALKWCKKNGACVTYHQAPVYVELALSQPTPRGGRLEGHARLTVSSQSLEDAVALAKPAWSAHMKTIKALRGDLRRQRQAVCEAD